MSRFVLGLGVLAFTVSAAVAGVQNDGTFELGNGQGGAGTADIVGSPSQPGCDWADLFDGTPTPDEFVARARACGGVDAAFMHDQFAGTGKDDTVFSSGSAKNDDPMSVWKWGTGSAPAKDDLSNFYAYAALNAARHFVLYAAVERLAPTGDSHVDFEFNQAGFDLDKPAPCGTDGTAGPNDGAPCEFTSTRTVGDLLLVMDFKKGGSLGFVEIRRWNGSAYALVEALGGEGCDAASTACAFNNAVKIDGGPWPNYDSKGNTIATLDGNAFTEVGVDVTALLGATPCFVSVAAKTRSSSSYSSELKDFAKASFDVCSFTIHKDGDPANPNPTLSKRGDDFTFRYTITNTGVGTLYLQSVIDTFFGDITADAMGPGGITRAGNQCNKLNASDSCSFTKAGAVPDDSDDPFETGVTATYGTIAPALLAPESLVSVTDDDTFALNLFQPSIDLVVTGDAVSAVGDAAAYTITITNTGSSDSPNLVNGQITDTVLGNLLDPANPYVIASSCTATLPTGGSCSISAQRVTQAGDPDPLVNTTSASYNPAGGFPNVIADSDSHSVDLVQPQAGLTISAAPAAGVAGDSITYTYVLVNTGNAPLERVSVVDSVLGDITSSFPSILGVGETATVVLTRPIRSGDPDPLVSVVSATYRAQGLDVLLVRSATVIVDVIVPIPCAKSPGYWKGGDGAPKWDDIFSDPIAQKAGFDGKTVFPWLHPSLAGTTYMGVLNLPTTGDVTRSLAFKYIAARLNQAAFNIDHDTAALLNEIDGYFAINPVGSDPKGPPRNRGLLLLDRLNAYFAAVGEGSCPTNF